MSGVLEQIRALADIDPDQADRLVKAQQPPLIVLDRNGLHRVLIGVYAGLAQLWEASAAQPIVESFGNLADTGLTYGGVLPEWAR